MASKRRQAASVTGAEKLLLTSSARRCNRRRATVEGGQHDKSPCSKNRAEERSLYKTPKRTQVSRSRLPILSSPTNENDMQQEIFWDPQSPTTYKLGNNQKNKPTVGGHTVEISEIVNRIAPQDEKPACCEGSLLGLWIGEDAIPCTPGITKVRSRTKINSARVHQLKHGEEELMKLAKQFDKNLIDAVREQYMMEPNTVHASAAAKLSSEHHIKVQTDDQWQLLNEHPTTNTALSLGILKENAGTAETHKSSSQKSIDLDAEGALNDLFDCPTQKCSGQLSQPLLNCSLVSVVEEKGTLLKAEHPLVSGGPLERSALLLQQHAEPVPAEKVKTTSVQTIPGLEFSNNHSDKAGNDDSYDWGADLFPDDSLLMQITQEPELMKIVEEAVLPTPEEKGESKERTVSSKKPSIAQAGVSNSSGTVPVSCVSRPHQNIWTEKAKVIPFHEGSSLKANKVDSSSKDRQNRTLDYNWIAVKSENKSMQHGFTQLKCAASISSPEKRTASISKYSDLTIVPTIKCKSHANYQSSVASTNKKLHDLKTARNQESSGYPKQTSVVKKGTFSFDDWSEPKFSDEVLELFCESSSFWGARCDDDDLLYQVCDDVEKKTLSQMGIKGTGKAKSMARNTTHLEQGLCQPGPNQGLSVCLQAQKNHAGRKTFSLDPPVATRKSENSANTSALLKGSFASGSGTASASSVQLNINNRQRLNGHNVGKIQSSCSMNQLSLSEKSKYMFKKTNSSQALVLNHKHVNVGGLSGTNTGLWESKNAPNIPFQKVINGKPDFKRHLSIDFAPSEKEHKSRRCSQEEIARKKQEALERRKYKMEALFKNTAPT